ncbi:Uncharacterised protein [Mycobacteroides abscessus subsp. abscessus]|nr:Uncharacterised protein [Mycobacteroides abscessus subsp. abscessus]
MGKILPVAECLSVIKMAKLAIFHDVKNIADLPICQMELSCLTVCMY